MSFSHHRLVSRALVAAAACVPLQVLPAADSPGSDLDCFFGHIVPNGLHLALEADGAGGQVLVAEIENVGIRHRDGSQGGGDLPSLHWDVAYDGVRQHFMGDMFSNLIVRIPTTSGRHTLVCLLDPDDEIAEFDESNNEATTIVDIPEGPVAPAREQGVDLAFLVKPFVTYTHVDPVAMPDQPADDWVTSITLVAGNNGTVAVPFTDLSYQGPGPVAPAGPGYVKFGSGTGMSTGGPLPPGTPFSFTLVLDPHGEVAEADEGNNTVVITGITPSADGSVVGTTGGGTTGSGTTGAGANGGDASGGASDVSAASSRAAGGGGIANGCGLGTGAVGLVAGLMAMLTRRGGRRRGA